jgi:hypothetical protein
MMSSWDRSIAQWRKFRNEIPDIIGAEMVTFSTDNIRTGSFEGKPWPARRSSAARNQGRGLLIDTGDGLRSIAYRKQGGFVKVVAIDYMVAHNEGARISGTFGVRSHSRRRLGRTERVRAHSRNVNIKLPQRQFSGPSRIQNQQIRTALIKRLNRILR